MYTAAQMDHPHVRARALIVWALVLTPFVACGVYAVVAVYAPLAHARSTALRTAQVVAAAAASAPHGDVLAVRSDPGPGQQEISALPYAADIPEDVTGLEVTAAGELTVVIGDFACTGMAVPTQLTGDRALGVPVCVHAF